MSMERKLVECVPNFSEGRNMDAIRQISQEIEQTKGVRLLNVDPGEATNRTVITFVGEPDAVVEAAFRAVRKAGQVIDMRQHHGAHPRIGATDVLPLIPVSGITLEECAQMARDLAKRIADELRMKLSTPGKEPDFGSRPFDDDIARTGCTVVGARDFLIAVNFNLNTTSTRRATAIAFDVREKGRPRREGNPITGKPMRDADGNTIMIPGTLKKTKAIGWYIDEYGIAQVSMNITDINTTPLHKAFDEVCRCAQARGIRVTGTEIVGLVPKRTLIEAGKYFLEKQHRSTGIPEDDIVKMAIHSMGLDDLRPFNPREKVIEYLLEDANRKPLLTDLTVKGFAEETSRESPAPGGGTISAYMGALGAALGTMVANLSAHKAGWDERWQEFSQSADEGQRIMAELLHLTDEDTEAFNRIMAAFGMPKTTDQEKALRTEAIQRATLYATEVPLRTMKAAAKVLPLCKLMATNGNPNSVSDAGVGALAARAAVLGAGLNVKINASSLHDRKKAEALIAEANALIAEANTAEQAIMDIVESKL